MEYKSLVERDRFERLIKEWEWQTDNIEKMSENRHETAAAINRVFGLVITEEKLLADLPWTIFFYNSRANSTGEGYLTCKYDNERTQEFLDKLVWKGNRYHFSHKLVVSDNELSFYDREITVSFDNVEAAIAFCKEQDIKPDVSTLNDQRQEAQQRADFFQRVISEFTAEQ